MLPCTATSVTKHPPSGFSPAFEHMPLPLRMISDLRFMGLLQDPGPPPPPAVPLLALPPPLADEHPIGNLSQDSTAPTLEWGDGGEEGDGNSGEMTVDMAEDTEHGDSEIHNNKVAEETVADSLSEKGEDDCDIHNNEVAEETVADSMSEKGEVDRDIDDNEVAEENMADEKEKGEVDREIDDVAEETADEKGEGDGNERTGVRKKPASNVAGLDRWLRRVPVGASRAWARASGGDDLHQDAHEAENGKLFKPEVEAELLEFMAGNGYPANKPTVHCDGKIPKWGMVVLESGAARIEPLARPCFGAARSLNLVLMPEGVQPGRKRKLPQSGLVKKPLKITRFGTLRRHAATHQVSSALGVRGCRDFANNVFYSTKYKKLMKTRKQSRGKFVNPRLGEWVMGLHRDWTSAASSASAPAASQKEGRFRSASLFSGVGGIELGVQKAMEAAVYVECDAAAQAVLRTRMADEHLPKGIIYDRVEDLDQDKLNGIEAITAGFPCPDIAISGARQGLGGERSSLFRCVVKSAIYSKCKVLFLENVAHLLSDDMMFVAPVPRKVLKRPAGSASTGGGHAAGAGTSMGEDESEEEGQEQGEEEETVEDNEQELASAGNDDPQAQPKRTRTDDGKEHSAGGEGDSAACGSGDGKLRPLQLFLKSRPNGMNVKERHDIWRGMSADEKSAYSRDTKELRGV